MKTRDLSARTVREPLGPNPSLHLLMPVLMIFGASLIGPIGRSHAQYGPAEQVGRALENAGRTIRRNVQNAIEVGQGAVPIPVVRYEQPLAARVFARLQWEKLLAGSNIELEVRDDGTVFLRGEVASKEAKERAFLLTRDTIGINKVVDELVATASTKKAAPDPLDPLPANPPTPAPPPPATAPAAMIRVRPARVVGRVPVGSTRVIVRPPGISAPATEVFVQP